jgi:hypothetical protein
MNKLYIFDFIISSFLAGINIYYVKDFRILIGLLWSFFILCSLLLNYNQILYFGSLYIIGVCVVAIYILKKIPFLPEYNIIFWLLYAISACVLMSIIISKKFIFNNIGTMPITGDRGITGKIGKSGISYNLKTYPEKCYDELIEKVETYITQTKIGNNIEFDRNDYQLKNLYFKDLLKKICLSHEFGDYIHGINTSKICEYDVKLKQRVLNGTKTLCTKNKLNNELNNENEIRYKRIVEELKKVVIDWIKEILKNNDYENKKLLTKLGYSENTDINKIYVLEDNKYNNKAGHTFLNDHFYNEKYFEQHIIKKNNANPFEKMKESDDFKILEIGNPYYWGKNNNNNNYNKCN